MLSLKVASHDRRSPLTRYGMTNAIDAYARQHDRGATARARDPPRARTLRGGRSGRIITRAGQVRVLGRLACDQPRGVAPPRVEQPQRNATVMLRIAPRIGPGGAKVLAR